MWRRKKIFQNVVSCVEKKLENIFCSRREKTTKKKINFLVCSTFQQKENIFLRFSVWRSSRIFQNLLHNRRQNSQTLRNNRQLGQTSRSLLFLYPTAYLQTHQCLVYSCANFSTYDNQTNYFLYFVKH